jgi:hypothetical protein
MKSKEQRAAAQAMAEARRCMRQAAAVLDTNRRLLRLVRELQDRECNAVSIIEACMPLLDAATLAEEVREICPDAPERARAFLAHRAVSRRGGREGAKTKRDKVAPRNDRIRERARQLEADGVSRRQIVPTLSEQFLRLSAKQIARVLKAAG